MKKAERNKIIRARANTAVMNMYHNATIRSFPDFRNDYESTIFWEWLTDAVSFEISELNYITKNKMKQNALVERAKYAPHEGIAEDYGLIYQWGRGGRTVAPIKLIKMRGGSSFSLIYDFFDDKNISDVTESILAIESFNETVKSWCKSVPSMWDEYKKLNGLNRVIWRYDNKRQFQKTAWR